MSRRLFFAALVAVLALAGSVTVSLRAAAPKYLLCAFPGKDGTPGGGGSVYMSTKEYGGMAGTVKACLAKGGHPAGATNDPKKDDPGK